MAGFTGQEIVRLLKERGVTSDFITVNQGISRINVKLRSREESEINGMGPGICGEDIDKLYDRLEQLQDGDTLVLAGSIPSVMPSSMYMDIMDHLQHKKLRIVVDATRDLLVNVLKYHPFLIKPNNHELGEIYGVTLRTREEVVPYARRIQQEGARNVLISMAGEGAVLLTEEGQVFASEAPKGKVMNSVGAGDSMVAGFLAGYGRKQDYEEAFYMGVCTGSASAFSEELATAPEVQQLLEQLGRA
jgi:1-phosphofructokinase